MERDPQDLLRRILRSRYFDDSGELALVLEYLCHTTQRGSAVGEEEIAASALGDASASNEIPSIVDEVRGRLRTFFETDGRSEELRLVIPHDGYRAFFYDADPVEVLAGQQSLTALQQFWAPHTVSESRMIHGVVNAAVPLEEVYAMIRLVMWLQDERIRVEVSGAGEPGPKPLILVGSAVTNPLILRFADPDDEAFALQRIPANSEHGVITVVRTLTGAQCATDDRLMAKVAEPFAGEFPPAFGLKV